MRIHFGGHLAFYHPQKQNWLDYDLLGPVSLCQVVELLGLPPAEIAFAVVNNNIADLETTIVNNNDTVQFYPPMDGG
jgi:molybdopterin converting factor small subunit